MELEKYKKERISEKKKKKRRNKTPNETLSKSHALGSPLDKQLGSSSSTMSLTSSSKYGEVAYNNVDRPDAMKKDEIETMIHVKKEKKRKLETKDLEGSHAHDRSIDVPLDNGTRKGFDKKVDEDLHVKVKKKKPKHVGSQKDGASSKSVGLTSDVVGFNMTSEAKIRRNEGKMDEDIIALNVGGQASDKVSCGKGRRMKKVLGSGNNLNMEISVNTEGSKIKKNKEPKDVQSRKQIVAPEEMTGEAQDSHSVGKNAEKATKSKRNKEKDSSECGTKNTSKSISKKKSRNVSFSDEVQVFTLLNEGCQGEEDEDNLVRGKRFTQEEDEIIKKAVYRYIKVNQLGEQGLDMVLHCSSYPQIKGCWKDIGACIPDRPYGAIYRRAHCIFERSEKRKWTPEEYELLRRYYELHGSSWKQIAELLGKHRVHVKDAWRRIRLPNVKKGQWSQDEYQGLFDLVNLDLRLKAFAEKKTKHGMLRDNIAWEAISQKLGTRKFAECCRKWYKQLTSSLVSEGLWADTDDYRLIEALENVDACCMEEVDWDNLLEHRPGEVCQKRWNQMVRYIGGHRERTFIEQVEVLSKRFCPEMLEYRK